MRTIDVQQAAEKSVQDLIALLQKKKQAARSMSLMTLDRNGKFGVGTNVDFSLGYAGSEIEPSMYTALSKSVRTIVRKKEKQ